MSTLRIAGMIGLVSLLGACASEDKHTFDSTPHLPTTIALMDTTNDTVFWKMDIPVWCRLKLDFDRKPEHEVFSTNPTFPATRLKWSIHYKDNNKVVKKGYEQLCGLPFVIKVIYREAPEYPEAVPAECLNVPGVEAVASNLQFPVEVQDQGATEVAGLAEPQWNSQDFQASAAITAAPAPQQPQFTNTQTATLGQPQPNYQQQPAQATNSQNSAAGYQPYQTYQAQPQPAYQAPPTYQPQSYQPPAVQEVPAMASAPAPAPQLSMTTTYTPPQPVIRSQPVAQVQPSLPQPIQPLQSIQPMTPLTNTMAALPAAPAQPAVAAQPPAQFNAAPDFSLSSMGSQPMQAADGRRNLPLNIDSELLEQYDPSVVNILVEGVPTNVMLSAGRNNGSGIWTLRGNQVRNLTMAVPAGMTQDVQLMIIATAPKPNGDTASTVSTLSVSLSPMAAATLK